MMPDVGTHLILNGFTIYSQFNDTNPEDILKLFLELSKLPDFDNVGLSMHLKENSDSMKSITARARNKMAKTKQHYMSDEEGESAFDEYHEDK